MLSSESRHARRDCEDWLKRNANSMNRYLSVFGVFSSNQYEDST